MDCRKNGFELRATNELWKAAILHFPIIPCRTLEMYDIKPQANSIDEAFVNVRQHYNNNTLVMTNELE